MARSAGVPLVIDAAAAIGGQLADGQRVGCSGDAEVFSLHATKVFGVGEGGVVMSQPELAERIRSVTNFGLVDGAFSEVGLNAKMSEFHAAVGLAVLRKMPAFVARRTELATRYRVALASMPGVRLPVQPGSPPWQTFPILLSGACRPEELVRHLADEGIASRRYYRPGLHRIAGFGPSQDLTVTDELAEQMVCLPIYSDMTNGEAALVMIEAWRLDYNTERPHRTLRQEIAAAWMTARERLLEAAG